MSPPAGHPTLSPWPGDHEGRAPGHVSIPRDIPHHTEPPPPPCTFPFEYFPRGVRDPRGWGVAGDRKKCKLNQPQNSGPFDKIPFSPEDSFSDVGGGDLSECLFFFRPKGAYGTSDEDLVVLTCA